MNTETFRFKIGALECLAISDGGLTYAPPMFPPPAVLLFSGAPSDTLALALKKQGLQPEEMKEWISPYTCLLIIGGGRLVLVDTGAGGLAPSTGKLLPNLKAAGISPEDVDTVILTHAHPDHTGGNVDAAGRPAFPRARYVIWKSEWDFWTSGQAAKDLGDHGRVLVDLAQRNLPPVMDRLELVDCETAILPGIEAVAAPGHTPGHMAVAVTSEGQQLLCLADTVLHPVHLEQPEWHAAVDLVPPEVAATRRRLLSRAAAGKALVHAFHFPFPALGHVVPRGTAWEWQPVQTAG